MVFTIFVNYLKNNIMSIIKSLLDSDLYKFTMQNAILQKFPRLYVRYSFTDRNKTVYPYGFANAVQEEINLMKNLQLDPSEIYFLFATRFLPPSYVDFLKGYRYNPAEVSVTQDKENHLHIEIEGYWYRTVLWEVPILAIVSELFYKKTNQIIDITAFNTQDLCKLRKMEKHNAYFSEFGTRRRYSFENQNRLISLFKTAGNHCFVGTSNVYLAYKYGIKAIGTMAHEWIMAHGALYGYRMANPLAMNNWSDVYNGDLGIALPDTFTTDVFLRTFDTKSAKLFDGMRQDSGDPYEFADKAVNHYKEKTIDPMSKTSVFSNALTIDESIEIKEYCVGKIKSSFGIGTHLTNDVEVKAMNIVMKLSAVKVNNIWIPAIKLSDDIGKNMGGSEEMDLCKRMLRIK